MSSIIVIPYYKNELKWYEELSLNRAFDVFSERQICLIAPESLDVTLLFRNHDLMIERFGDHYFTGTTSYNRLMLSNKFYMRFSQYDYILIYQLDAFVFSDQLDYFLDLDYDYIGAPWFYCESYYKGDDNKYYKTPVGNGGFSLRKTEAFINLIEQHKNESMSFMDNEDAFFPYMSLKYPDSIKIAPFDVASHFSFECEPRKLFKYNSGVIPFGCHGWMKYDPEFYKEIFHRFDIDISMYNYCELKYDMNTEKRRLIRRQFDNLCLSTDLFNRILFKEIPSDNGYYIFGAGKYAKKIIQNIDRNKITIRGIIDNNHELWNKTILGFKVFSPEIISNKDKIIVILRKGIFEVEEQLSLMGLRRNIDYVVYDKLDEMFSCEEMSFEEMRGEVDLYNFFIKQLA